MTDHHHPGRDDELRALCRHVFGSPNLNPADPTGRVTLAEIVEFSRNWQRSRGRTDAVIETDTDGNPLSVGESHPVLCAGLAICQADAERLGIATGDYPGILIIPNPKGNTP